MINDFEITHASLFTGIGGFDLAAEWMGWVNVFQVENNKYCLNNLAKNFPTVTKYADIKEFNGTPYAGRIDVLTGGFPCQTFSVAGKGAVDLTLWKEMFRTITEIKPPYVVAENVPGIVSRKNGMAFNTVCADLESAGYEVQPLNIPIAGKGAPHERERIWFIAYAHRFRCSNEQKENRQTIYNQKRNSEIAEQLRQMQQCGLSESDSNTTNANSKRLARQGKYRRPRNDKKNGNRQANQFIDENQFKESWYEVATRLCRVDDGIPGRVDRIMALGNSISPILAYEFFKIIDTLIQQPE
jgi:DNA (cytosine-5)-methyltransferase 1